MAVDVLAPCVARPSAAVVLNMGDKHVLVFYKEGFLYLHHHIVEK